MPANTPISDELLTKLSAFCPPPAQRKRRTIRYQTIKSQIETLANELNLRIHQDRMGWIARIRLIYRLQQQLRQQGYEPELIRRLITLFIFAAVQRPN